MIKKNGWTVVFATALTMPLLVFYHYPPNGSVFADALSLVLWAGVATIIVLTGLNASEGRAKPLIAGMITTRIGDHLKSPKSAALILSVAIFCWAIQVRQGQYGFLSVVFTTLGAAVAAWAAFAVGARWTQRKDQGDCAAHFALALLWMGVAVAGIGWVQYFFPQGYWPWISSLGTPGRIYANVRQPNHLALILAWAVWGTIWQATRTEKVSRSAIAALLFVVPVLAMTGSRMGQALLAGFLVLAWLSPNRVLRFKVALLAATIYAVAWLLVGFIAQNGGPAFFGLRGAIFSSTGSRFELWTQVVQVIGQVPWYGCGLGQFNFCWTHAVLDERVFGAVFHAHNLVLHGLVEWGWPLTALVMIWIALGLCLFLRYGTKTAAALPAGIFLASLLHAMLEYPWWYTYLLLPTAFALGWMWSLSYCEYQRAERVVLDSSQTDGTVDTAAKSLGQTLRVLVPGVLLLCFGTLYVQQYLPLRFLFAAGYVKPLTVQELREINSEAALFSMPLSYAIVMKLTENAMAKDAASMLPYLKLAGRGTNDPEFLARFAVIAALAQENAMAKHLAWRAIQSDPSQQEKLVKKVMQINSALLSDFAAYLQKPEAITLDRSVFAR